MQSPIKMPNQEVAEDGELIKRARDVLNQSERSVPEHGYFQDYDQFWNNDPELQVKEMLHEQSRLEKCKIDEYSKKVKRAVAGGGKTGKSKMGNFANFENPVKFSIFDSTTEAITTLDK